MKIIHSMDTWLKGTISTPNTTDLWTNWQPLENLQSATPLKTSVSSLSKKQTLNDPLPLTDAEEDMEDKRREEEITAPLRLSELPARPAFMEEKRLSGAERGTLMHRVLSLMPLEALRDAPVSEIPALVHQQAHAMVECGQLTSEELMAVSLRRITDFFTGELGQRMLQSNMIRREWSFNLLMNETGTLLQGVIDCAFREGDHWVLLDYKTDRIEDEAAFVERYTLQLTWYARAVEAITGCPVREKWLCALSTGRCYVVS